MIARLAVPGLLPTGDASAGVLALSPNEQTIYAISASGLNVLVLPSTVDQITPFPWPHVAAPSNPLKSAARRQNPPPLNPAFGGIVPKRYHLTEPQFKRSRNHTRSLFGKRGSGHAYEWKTGGFTVDASRRLHASSQVAAAPIYGQCCRIFL